MPYQIFNWESGCYEEVDKQTYERYKSAIDYFKPTIESKDNKPVGRIQVASTQSGEDENEFYQNIWYDKR